MSHFISDFFNAFRTHFMIEWCFGAALHNFRFSFAVTLQFSPLCLNYICMSGWIYAVINGMLNVRVAKGSSGDVRRKRDRESTTRLLHFPLRLRSDSSIAGIMWRCALWHQYQALRCWCSIVFAAPSSTLHPPSLPCSDTERPMGHWQPLMGLAGSKWLCIV